MIKVTRQMTPSPRYQKLLDLMEGWQKDDLAAEAQKKMLCNLFGINYRGAANPLTMTVFEETLDGLQRDVDLNKRLISLLKEHYPIGTIVTYEQYGLKGTDTVSGEPLSSFNDIIIIPLENYGGCPAMCIDKEQT